MSDEVQNDEVVVDESLPNEEEVEIVSEDIEDKPDFGAKISDLEQKVSKTSETVDLVGTLNEGFKQLGNNLSQSLQSISRANQPVVEDVDPLDNLTDEEISQMSLVEGRKLLKLQKDSYEKRLAKEISAIRQEVAGTQAMLVLNTKENDPNIGQYVKEYRGEIEAGINSLDPRYRSQPAYVDMVINTVLGKHTAEIISRGSKKVSNPVAPNLAKGGQTTSSSTGKRVINLKSHFTEAQLNEFRNVRGMTDAEIAKMI